MEVEKGMVVWIKRSEPRDVEKLWHVTETGIMNEHNYPLDVKIKNPFGEEMVVSTVSSWDWGEYPRVAIFPKQQPKILEGKQFLKAILNGGADNLKVMCEKCLTTVGTRSTMTEVASLRIDNHGPNGYGKDERFTEDKPEVEESGREVYCSCENNPDFENLEFDLYS